MAQSKTKSGSSNLAGFSTRILPIAVALLASHWMLFLHIYRPPRTIWLPWTILSLAFLLILGRAHLHRQETFHTVFFCQPRWGSIVGAAACALLFITLPFPYSLCALPLGVGWLLICWLPSVTLLRTLATALIDFGVILLGGALLFPLFAEWAVRVHQLSGPATLFTPMIYGFLKLLGQSVDLIQGSLYLRTFEDLFRQTITTEKLFPMPFFIFTFLWSGVIVLRGSKMLLERLLLFWLTIAVYCIIRLSVLLLIMIQRGNPSYFWDPLAILISFLPLALLLREPDDFSTEPSLEKKKTSPKRSLVWVGVLLGFICGASIITAYAYREAGTLKAGRVLINEHGSDWEWTTEPLNTDDYNERTTYNYYCLAEFLNYYYQVSKNFEPLTPEILSDVDVLILKTPTQHYTASEIETVVEFVRRGGGVWVIGDHTNVFGTSQYLNPLLNHFGFRLNYDSTHDLETGNLSLFEKPRIFAHPSVINLSPYLFATSCSMQAPWHSESAIIGYGMRADYLDYSQKNFFPDRKRKQFDIQFGLIMQQAGKKLGAGRLLLYTDSTTFSNFFMFIKGKPELALGSVNWLNRQNQHSWLKAALLLIGVVALVALLSLKSWHGLTLAVLLLGGALAGVFAEQSARVSYALPQPIRPAPRINFERECSSYFLPTLRLGDEKDISYLTFYVWTQRLNGMPREVYNLAEAFAGRDPVVMIDPKGTLNDGQIETIRQYLTRGGKLLLLNSADNASETPKKLLSHFGLQLNTTISTADSLHTLTLAGRYFPLRINGKFSDLHGGEPFLKSDQGDGIGVSVTIGEGRLWAISCGQIFRNQMMGQTSVQPDAGLKALYEIEYDLIRELLQGYQQDTVESVEKPL
ncbi:MAG: hypothetical protein ABH878_04970 [bacterium]